MSTKMFYPYHYAEQALELAEITVDIDGEAGAGNDFVDKDHASINITALEKEWQSLVLNIRVNDPNNGLPATLPDGVSEEVLQVWIVARNKATRLRISVPLVRNDGKWSGQLTLPKSELARATDLECFATLATDIDPVEGYAFKAHERIADAAGWKLYTDIIPSMPGGALNSQWVNFVESNKPELNKRTDCVWYLDLSDSEAPQLLLNEAVPKLRQALEVESKTSKPARVRDALIHSILQAVINELAVFTLVNANGAPLTELLDWQQKLLTSLARKDDSASEELVAKRWITSWQVGTEAGQVLAELNTSVQRHLNLIHSSEYLAKSVEKEIDND